MKYSVRLVSLARVVNRKLVVKRVASDLSGDLYKADLLLRQLPLILEHSVSEEEANKMIHDYDRLGCTVMKELEKEPEKPADTGPNITVTAVVDPRMHGQGLRVSLAPPPPPPPKRRNMARDILIMTGLLLAMSTLIFIAYRASQKKQEAARKNRSAQNAAAAVAATGAVPAEDDASNPENKPSRMRFAGDGDDENIAGEENGTGSRNNASEEKGTSAGEEARSASAETPEKTAAAIEKGLDRGPERLAQKGGYSDELLKKAEDETDADFRIKFFELAVSFNKFNEPAWKGLITAYEEARKPGKAENARREKEAIFGTLLSRVNDAVAEYGKMKGRPVFSENSVAVGYEAKKDFSPKTLPEMKALAEKIKSIQSFRRVSVTVHTNAGSMTEDF
ncbi:MAG: hypothetical protein V1913_03775 [Fibrobacterota bacterium]